MGLDRQKTVIFTAAAAAVIGVCSLGAVMTWQTFQGGSRWKWQYETGQGWIRKGENIWIFAGPCGRNAWNLNISWNQLWKRAGYFRFLTGRERIGKNGLSVRESRKSSAGFRRKCFLRSVRSIRIPEPPGRKGSFISEGLISHKSICLTGERKKRRSGD